MVLKDMLRTLNESYRSLTYDPATTTIWVYWSFDGALSPHKQLTEASEDSWAIGEYLTGSSEKTGNHVQYAVMLDDHISRMYCLVILCTNEFVYVD